MKRDVLIFHKVLLLIMVRKMLGVATEELFIHTSIKANSDEISKALLFLTEKNYVAKVTSENKTYYELTEKGIDSESVGLADLFAKAVVWFE
jgi:predicted transcriptional regulator